MAAFAVTVVTLASSAPQQEFPVVTSILDSASVNPMRQVNRPLTNIAENHILEVLIFELHTVCLVDGDITFFYQFAHLSCSHEQSNSGML